MGLALHTLLHQSGSSFTEMSYHFYLECSIAASLHYTQLQGVSCLKLRMFIILDVSNNPVWKRVYSMPSNTAVRQTTDV